MFTTANTMSLSDTRQFQFAMRFERPASGVLQGRFNKHYVIGKHFGAGMAIDPFATVRDHIL